MQSTNGIASNVNNNNASDKSPLGDGKDSKESITTSKMDETKNNALKEKKEEQSITTTAVSESTEKIAGIKSSLFFYILTPLPSPPHIHLHFKHTHNNVARIIREIHVNFSHFNTK